MRIATYNVEWFNNLFDDRGGLLGDDGWSGRQNVTRIQQIEALGIVFTALDADAVMVIEAPDHNGRRATAPALENFARTFDIRARKVLMGFSNETQQEIALMYDPDVLSAWHDPLGDPTGKKGSEQSPRFDSVFRIDLDIDNTEDLVRFSKPPLEVALKTKAGDALWLIGVHLKSKAPHGAHSKHAVMRTAIANRRKQLAQAIWLRRRVEDHLIERHPLIVLGDLNDGPGLDEYEDLFGRSSVEIVMGENGELNLYDPHALMALHQRIGALPSTARFHMPKGKRYLQALLDYIMVSEDLRARNGIWRIWHPYDDERCLEVSELRDALICASDHFPVTLDIDLTQAISRDPSTDP